MFKILSNQTEIRLYLPFSYWFRTKQTSVWFQINRKMVNTIWFLFGLMRFRNDFSVCAGKTTAATPRTVRETSFLSASWVPNLRHLLHTQSKMWEKMFPRCAEIRAAFYNKIMRDLAREFFFFMEDITHIYLSIIRLISYIRYHTYYLSWWTSHFSWKIFIPLFLEDFRPTFLGRVREQDLTINYKLVLKFKCYI